MNGTPNTNAHILAQIILNISKLSSAPTDLWTTLAARCIVSEDQNISISIVIAIVNHATMVVRTESAGVSLSSSQQTKINADLARCGMDHLGSLTKVTLESPVDTQNETHAQGVVGFAQDLLPKWSQSHHSQHWVNQQESDTLAACIPLQGSYNKAFNSSIAMIAIAKPSPTTREQPSCITDPHQFAAITAALADKATTSLARQNNGSILWLTEREHTILNHLIEGLSVRSIAEHIKRSPHTVHDHVKNLHRKLGASSRGQLIAIATGHQATGTHTRLQQPRILPSLLQSPYRSPQSLDSQHYAQPASVPTSMPTQSNKEVQHSLKLTKKMTPYQPSAAKSKHQIQDAKLISAGTNIQNYQQINQESKPARLKATPLNHPGSGYPKSNY
ncbi:MAG: response regulator transcription factor [Phycisphaerales bacterium]